MKQILSVTINEEKCIGCGKCVADCVSHNLELKEGKAAYKHPVCLECGHCFAICPTGAVDMPAYDTADCGKTASLAELDEDRLLLAMKSRRSIRQFTKQRVEAEKMAKILEAGRYAPTAKNAQPTSYILIDEKMDLMEKLAAETFEHLKSKVSAIAERAATIELTENFFFKGGNQAVLLVSESALDAGLAASYMELMAESMGIGVLYSGFFAAAARFGTEIRAELEIAKDENVVTCMVFGYPDVDYERTVPRLPLRLRRK